MFAVCKELILHWSFAQQKHYRNFCAVFCLRWKKSYSVVVGGVWILVTGDDLWSHPIGSTNESVPSTNCLVQLSRDSKVNWSMKIWEMIKEILLYSLVSTLHLAAFCLTQFDLGVLREQNILSLYVSVDHMMTVKMGKTLEDKDVHNERTHSRTSQMTRKYESGKHWPSKNVFVTCLDSYRPGLSDLWRNCKHSCCKEHIFCLF